eukprot:509886_1
MIYLLLQLDKKTANGDNNVVGFNNFHIGCTTEPTPSPSAAPTDVTSSPTFTTDPPTSTPTDATYTPTSTPTDVTYTPTFTTTDETSTTTDQPIPNPTTPPASDISTSDGSTSDQPEVSEPVSG